MQTSTWVFIVEFMCTSYKTSVNGPYIHVPNLKQHLFRLTEEYDKVCFDMLQGKKIKKSQLQKKNDWPHFPVAKLVKDECLWIFTSPFYNSCI